MLAIAVFILAKQNRELKNPYEKKETRNIRAGEAMSVEGLIALDAVSLDSSAAGLVYVFSTVCPFCERNIESWRNVAEMALQKGLTVTGICLADADSAAHYARRHGLDFPIYVPQDIQSFRNQNHIGGVPNTILTAAGFRVEEVWLGLLNEEQLKEIAASISQTKPITLKKRGSP